MVTQITTEPDPTVLYYLKAQATVTLGFAAFIGLGAAIVFLFSVDKIKLHNIPWLVIGLAAVVFFCYHGVRALKVQTPELALDESETFRVGARTITLDDSTEFVYDGDVSALTLPEAKNRGYGAMPGGIDFPPNFAGGPTVTVKTRSGDISFQPLLYGPAAYVDSRRADSAALVQQLVTFGEGGNAREWLQSAFTPVAGEPAPEPNFRKFMITFLFIAVPILGFLSVAVVIGMGKRFFS